MSAPRVAAVLLLGMAAVAGAAVSTPRTEIGFETSEGTWISLDVSADGKSIVFDLLGDLYELPIDGGVARPLLTGRPFESQPVYSPDGTWIAFVSDRSGSENLWIARRDGSEPRALSNLDDDTEFSSPAWSADGTHVFVSRIRVSSNVFELWEYPLDAGEAKQLTRGAPQPGWPKRNRNSALGAVSAHDGRHLFYAARMGDFLEQHAYEQLPMPLWRVVRRDLRTGTEETVVASPGGAMRPRLSPDDSVIVYGSRRDGQTGLRMRRLRDGSDEWLSFPAQRDQQEGWPSRDVLPAYAFTPDGKSIVLSRDGQLERVDLATRAVHRIPFTANVSIQAGSAVPRDIVEDTGPVLARLIQGPAVSPDGRNLAFSALGSIYVMRLQPDARPRRLTTGSLAPQFQPSWSPDGRWILFATWTARGGHIWKARADGKGAAQRLTAESAYYSDPVATRDGREILALRSSNHQHTHQYIEIGPFRQADLVRMPASGGPPAVITSGMIAGPPQPALDGKRVHLYRADGVASIALDGSDARLLLRAGGIPPHFHEGPFRLDDVRVSPDGKWALALGASQLHLVQIRATAGQPQVVDLDVPSPEHRQLTAVGADFIGWADDGRSITWSVGSTLYRMPLSDARRAEGQRGIEGGAERLAQKHQAVVTLPRDVPQGALVLRGGTAITMRGDESIADADVLVRNDRIVAVGRRGSIPIPADARIRDVTGKFVLPGFVDTHAHWVQVRRGILDLEDWGLAANLAYGVTAGLDPSPLTIDALAYRDLLDAGLMIGLRAYSTGPAVLSWNRFTSREQVSAVLSRYRDHYRLRNLKSYWSANRRQRQWVADVASELGLIATTEGALNEKLILTQVMDGFSGSEHALPTVPVSQDVIDLFARSRVSYTPTLVVGNGGPHARSRLIAPDLLHDDAKLNRFVPHHVIDELTQRRPTYAQHEYVYPRVAAGAAKILRAGGLIGVGSHGELQGLAYHWEMQALATEGLTPMEVLRSATLGSSETIGRARDLGSLESGKLADLLVLDRDPRANIADTLSIREVMKNGRLYEAETLDEVWPRQRTYPVPWFREEPLPAH